MVDMVELKVEFRPAPGGRAIHLWHVVHEGGSTGLCGRALSPSAGTLPIAEIEELKPGNRCQACRSAYRATLPPGG
ncbi:hypothetical protein ACEZCY_15790 [Streptacidiphilus sp. N1-12]|uniref:Uncharacterized protein n=2 Tax=Streptacidiphilus alkalitolerans TaxID=3342712 RepID=A0ABV6VB00_9ACTN